VIYTSGSTGKPKGLKVTCRLDLRKYPIGREVSNAQRKRINLERNKFHGEWNYKITPSTMQT
jgi:acyl-CoA synthetase (AMP-forming)/AMP-acid ligase II